MPIIPLQDTAQVYRFVDTVAMHTTPGEDSRDSCPTIYLTPDMAEAIGKALLHFADSIKTEDYQRSAPSVRIERCGFSADSSDHPARKR